MYVAAMSGEDGSADLRSRRYRGTVGERMDSSEESEEASVVEGEELGNAMACCGTRDSALMVTGSAKSPLSAVNEANALWSSADARNEEKRSPWSEFG